MKRILLGLTIALSLSLIGQAEAQTETIDLSELEIDFGQLNATITLPEKPRKVDTMAAQYNFIFEDGSLLILDKVFDGNFEDQKALDLEFYESEAVLEEDETSVLYQGKILDNTQFFYLSYQDIDDGWFCQVSGESEARIRELSEVCQTIEPKE